MADMHENAAIHLPVLFQEVLEYLAPKPGGVYVDGTLGLGGHSLGILQRSVPDGRVIAFEWDQAAMEISQQRLKDYSSRLTILRQNFAEIGPGLKGLGVDAVDGLIVDIGMSSLQLDAGCRGFSFKVDEPLDMRMDTRREITAASLLAKCSEEELADIFYYFGEEKQARPIAAEIVRARKLKVVESSKELAQLVARAIPRRFHPKKIHVATKVFQALRIAVNTEFENLARLLDDGPALLKPGAALCVISFHSLEDRMVKRKFKEHSLLDVITAQPVMATAAEISANPRARSARLRVARKRDQGGDADDIS